MRETSTKEEDQRNQPQTYPSPPDEMKRMAQPENDFQTGLSKQVGYGTDDLQLHF